MPEAGQFALKMNGRKPVFEGARRKNSRFAWESFGGFDVVKVHLRTFKYIYQFGNFVVELFRRRPRPLKVGGGQWSLIVDLVKKEVPQDRSSNAVCPPVSAPRRNAGRRRKWGGRRQKRGPLLRFSPCFSPIFLSHLFLSHQKTVSLSLSRERENRWFFLFFPKQVSITSYRVSLESRPEFFLVFSTNEHSLVSRTYSTIFSRT